MKKAALTILILATFVYLYSANFKDMTKLPTIGDKFTRLTLISFLGIVNHRTSWLCKCDCGNDFIVAQRYLLEQRTKSCGCYNRSGHHLTNSPIYRSWRGMRDRCYKKTHHQFHNYGGRGITVDERWRTSFVNFYADMGERPKGHTLDRKDNNGQYCKDNCRWATSKEQQNNKRSNHILTYKGKTMNVTQWANELGIDRNKIYARITRRGWTTERALST